MPKDSVKVQMDLSLRFESEDASRMVKVFAVPDQLKDFLADALMRRIQQAGCHPSILGVEVRLIDFDLERK